MIAASGRRAAYVLLAVISAVIVLPAALLLVRVFPKDKGLKPLGAGEEEAPEGELTGLRLGDYIKTGSFWLLVASFFIIGFANMGLQNNISIYLTKIKGHSTEYAANIFLVVMFVQIFGRILPGVIYDKKGVKFGAVYCMISYTLAVLSVVPVFTTVLAVKKGERLKGNPEHEG